MSKKRGERRQYVARGEKKELILGVAMDLAREKGLSNLFRTEIVERSGVAAGSVNYCFDTMDGLKLAVMKKAVEDKELSVIAQGLIARDEIALNAPAELKQQALNSMM